MAIHLVGAPHSGVHELLEALTAKLGVHTAQLHPLMQALPSADSTLPASPEASLPPLTPITLLTGLDWPCPPAEQDNREQCDAGLRRQLQASGTPYRVVYGSTARRLTTALAAAQALQRKYPDCLHQPKARFGTRTAQGHHSIFQIDCRRRQPERWPSWS